MYWNKYAHQGDQWNQNSLPQKPLTVPQEPQGEPAKPYYSTEYLREQIGREGIFLFHFLSAPAPYRTLRYVGKLKKVGVDFVVITTKKQGDVFLYTVNFGVAEFPNGPIQDHDSSQFPAYIPSNRPYYR